MRLCSVTVFLIFFGLLRIILEQERWLSLLAKTEHSSPNDFSLHTKGEIFFSTFYRKWSRVFFSSRFWIKISFSYSSPFSSHHFHEVVNYFYVAWWEWEWNFICRSADEIVFVAASSWCWSSIVVIGSLLTWNWSFLGALGTETFARWIKI